MKSFDIGLSALKAQQQTLSVLGNNLANAATPGYHRQRVELANRPPLQSEKLHVGSGVDVIRITRLRNSALEAALLRNSSETGTSEQTLEIAKQIESLVTPGDGAIQESLSNFFNRMEKVSNAPQDMTVRQEFLNSASELMDAFNSMSGQLTSLRRDVRMSVDDGVKQLNQLTNDIAGLNARIFVARVQGSEPNDMLDRRDQLLTSLSEWVEADADSLSGDREKVLVAGSAVVGSQSVTFRARDYKDGTTGIAVNELSTAIPLNSGKLHALTTALNETIPAFEDRIRELSRQIVRAVDQQHAQGMTDKGPFSVLLGVRSVKDVSVPLRYSSPEFPITSGDLAVTITENATGIRRTERIAIDTTTDSLTDVAAKLDALNGVAASVDPVRKTLLVSAEGPYSIDFAGRPDNIPVLTSMTGTSIPKFSGFYSGSSNNDWNVTFSGAGTIGVTPGLTATIEDSGGQIIGVRNIGAGYEPGTAFDVASGVSLTFAAGTIEAADTFSLAVIKNSDETGILSALGINSLFTGSEPGLFHVRGDLKTNPNRLSSSTGGSPGDAINIASMATLRDIRLNDLGSRTFVEDLADLTAEAGLLVQSADSQSTQLMAYQARLNADRDALSGVDINQEMLEMMQTQRSYQAAARYLSTADQMLDDLFQLAR
jgi:flagellar hook-associated protein 1 FlgK